MFRFLITFLLSMVLLFSVSNTVVGQKYSSAQIEAILKYRQLTGRLFTNYQIKIDRLKKSLRNSIDKDFYKSLAGVKPEDTAWAIATVKNQKLMTEIYTENRAEKRHTVARAHSFRVENGQIIFNDSQLSPFKADPAENSIIKIVATGKGVRIPATTQLTTIGMEIQASQGCTHCHSI